MIGSLPLLTTVPLVEPPSPVSLKSLENAAGRVSITSAIPSWSVSHMLLTGVPVKVPSLLIIPLQTLMIVPELMIVAPKALFMMEWF